MPDVREDVAALNEDVSHFWIGTLTDPYREHDPNCQGCRLVEARAELERVEGERARLEEAIQHVVADSPGTPESVKQYLWKALHPEGEKK